MAKEKETAGLKLYGAGTETQQRNPFMPLESSYSAGKKGIVSNRGSNFAMEMHKGNAMDDLDSHRGLSGSTTDSLTVNDK